MYAYDEFDRNNFCSRKKGFNLSINNKINKIKQNERQEKVLQQLGYEKHLTLKKML